ncbi:hypothetical protein [Arcobacter vandammei]|uniref:hypothetical protein n=1 Tax=Arcobacter vandammei TaxID=2782243 RepID=UPI0018DF75F3|nr:hypothetical protein [Arcobacter vandammei]
MKLNKIIDKIKKYLKQDSLKESKEKKLLILIEDLKEKRTKLREELKELKKAKIEERIAIQKKVEAINKLLKKSRILIKSKD